MSETNLSNPPMRADPPGELRFASTSAMVRRVRIGQHLIAGLLVVVGVFRAVSEGTGSSVAITAGLALGVCYGFGATLGSGSRGAWTVHWWLLGLTAVWVGAVWVSAGFVWFVFVLWLLAGHLLPGGRAVMYAVFVYLVAVAAPIAHHATVEWADVVGPLVGGLFALGISRGYLRLLHDGAERERLLDSLALAQREMSELQDELALTQRHSGAIAERTRLSRDIHDTVAQNLSSIRLLAHAAGRGAEPETARAFGQVETLAADGLADVRRIVAALAPDTLDGALAGALARMLDQLAEQSGLTTHLHVDDTLPALPTEVEVALMRVAQSALANVRLHAHASRVVVSLIDDGDAVRLDVIDDGQGFDVPSWDGAISPQGESGYGLRFMRSRLRELGGGLDIESTPGDGTALSAQLPVHFSTTEA